MIRRIYKYLKAAGNIIDQFFLYLGVFLMTILFISCLLQVFTRYVLNNSLSWTEEISRYSFVWVSLIGAVLATSQKAHCVVTVLDGVFKGRSKQIQQIFIMVCILLGGLVMLTQGIKMVQATIKTLSVHLKIPMGYVYLAVPVSGFGITVHALVSLLGYFLPQAKEETI